jgi:hypothetical protein
VSPRLLDVVVGTAEADEVDLPLPRIGSQPVRYGEQVPVMITPARRDCSRNS